MSAIVILCFDSISARNNPMITMGVFALYANIFVGTFLRKGLVLNLLNVSSSIRLIEAPVSIKKEKYTPLIFIFVLGCLSLILLLIVNM